MVFRQLAVGSKSLFEVFYELAFRATLVRLEFETELIVCRSLKHAQQIYTPLTYYSPQSRSPTVLLE